MSVLIHGVVGSGDDANAYDGGNCNVVMIVMIIMMMIMVMIVVM